MKANQSALLFSQYFLKVVSSLSKPHKTIWSLQKDLKNQVYNDIQEVQSVDVYLIRWWKEFLLDQGCFFLFFFLSRSHNLKDRSHAQEVGQRSCLV